MILRSGIRDLMRRATLIWQNGVGKMVANFMFSLNGGFRVPRSV